MLAKINPVEYLEKKGILCGTAGDSFVNFIGVRYSEFEDIVAGKRQRSRHVISPNQTSLL